MSLQTKAKAVGEYVGHKICILQTGILAGDSSARATLSRLRHGVSGSAANWIIIGNDIYSDWPVESLGDPGDDVFAVNAVTAALGLYSLHQQSQHYGVAQLEMDGDPSISFGKACRMIGYNNRVTAQSETMNNGVTAQSETMNNGVTAQSETMNNGVIRRLSAAAAAPTFDGKIWFFRALIRLMRSDDSRITLNYQDFARDLYLIQRPETSSQVFQRWSCDYFYRPSTIKD